MMEIMKQPELIGLLQLLAGAVIGVAGVIAWAETRFSNKSHTKELLEIEAKERENNDKVIRADVLRLYETVDRKLDQVYKVLLDHNKKP